MPFSEFRKRHPAFLAIVAVIIVGLLALDGWVLYKRAAYAQEVARLRAGMSDFERRRSDAVTNTHEAQTAMMMELLRRQAKIDKEIHLAVDVDSGRMYLERDGALLRENAVEVAPEKRLGAGKDTVRMAAPRGTRRSRARPEPPPPDAPPRRAPRTPPRTAPCRASGSRSRRRAARANACGATAGTARGPGRRRSGTAGPIPGSACPSAPGRRGSAARTGGTCRRRSTRGPGSAAGSAAAAA